MAFRDTQEPTPKKVEDLATTEARLPRLALLGVVGSESAPAALIRERDGDIAKVTPGDRVAGRDVTAIGNDHVVLTRGGTSKVLRLPPD